MIPPCSCGHPATAHGDRALMGCTKTEPTGPASSWATAPSVRWPFNPCPCDAYTAEVTP